MSARDISEVEKISSIEDEMISELLCSMLENNSVKTTKINTQQYTLPSIVIGELIGMTNDGQTPLVRYPGQPGTKALFARSVIDLKEAHFGRQIILIFEDANATQPIIMGVLQEGRRLPLDQRPDQVEVDADDERMIITAKEQLVLRCGKASITLTKAGKVLIQGEYVLSHSSGLNRIRGGAIQLN